MHGATPATVVGLLWRGRRGARAERGGNDCRSQDTGVRRSSQFVSDSTRARNYRVFTVRTADTVVVKCSVLLGVRGKTVTCVVLQTWSSLVTECYCCVIQMLCPYMLRLSVMLPCQFFLVE